MVGAADTMVSPSSSSTRRSTPCVLGCCGPMLTVIVSLRISAIAVYLPLDEIAHRMNQRAMYFLDPRREVVRDIHVQICRRADDAAVAAGEGDGFQPTRFRVLQSREHVRGAAARRDPHGNIALPPMRLDLPHEHAIEA